ncbi:hypothetical protein DY000_02026840 [Brassica cretica]|uniref:glucan endo-1,3-beta-D-glucosidase n=1 Tax=Brassica cretica TaxID=69181 RepID=A0ABQ7E5K2_BRACR|nr:hypothetical protein DY000_02026840 [Brassica cretica]
MTSRTVARLPNLINVFLLLSLVFSGNILQKATSLGINYGQVGNNLPSPDKVINLLRSLRITKTRIYDTNPQILTSFANSNIEIIVTIENQVLTLLQDPQQALQWVDSHIKPYIPATRITGIMVGNELFTDEDSSLIGSFERAHPITDSGPPHLHPIVISIVPSSSSFSKPRECDEIYTVESELIPIPSPESVSISRIAASPLRHSSSRPPIWISLFLQGKPFIISLSAESDLE